MSPRLNLLARQRFTGRVEGAVGALCCVVVGAIVAHFVFVVLS